jgi:hypothetical protein
MAINSTAGIAYRWNSPLKEKWNYTLYNAPEILNMTRSKLETLSPAEKYDIYAQSYSFPTVRSEWTRTKPTDPNWVGICNGWSQAAFTYEQPNEIVLKNRDGVEVPFGSSDVKALLSFFIAFYDIGALTNYIGKRCNYNITAEPDKGDTPECVDINAGAFHVAITNQLGLKGLGFAADVDRSIMIWNQPIAKYNATILSTKKSKTPGVAEEVQISLWMDYVNEIDANYKPVPPNMTRSEYVYWVELDGDGAVVGGYHQTFDRLDFAWKSQTSPFSGYFSLLEEIYEASVGIAPINKRAVRKSQFEGRQATTLTTLDGIFEYSGRYNPGSLLLWHIKPANAKKIGIKFTNVRIGFEYDMIRVFERSNGPLILVVTGNQREKRVELEADELYVSFTSKFGGEGSFTAAYYSI